MVTKIQEITGAATGKHKEEETKIESSSLSTQLTFEGIGLMGRTWVFTGHSTKKKNAAPGGFEVKSPSSLLLFGNHWAAAYLTLVIMAKKKLLQ